MILQHPDGTPATVAAAVAWLAEQPEAVAAYLATNGPGALSALLPSAAEPVASQPVPDTVQELVDFRNAMLRALKAAFPDANEVKLCAVANVVIDQHEREHREHQDVLGLLRGVSQHAVRLERSRDSATARSEGWARQAFEERERVAALEDRLAVVERRASIKRQ